MSKLLEVNKLCAWYGATQALYDVDFSLEAGHITAILGANGAGKTTTLRALCQVVKTSGSIQLDGQQMVTVSYSRTYAPEVHFIELGIAERGESIVGVRYSNFRVGR